MDFVTWFHHDLRHNTRNAISSLLAGLLLGVAFTLVDYGIADGVPSAVTHSFGIELPVPIPRWADIFVFFFASTLMRWVFHFDPLRSAAWHGETNSIGLGVGILCFIVFLWTRHEGLMFIAGFLPSLPILFWGSVKDYGPGYRSGRHGFWAAAIVTSFVIGVAFGLASMLISLLAFIATDRFMWKYKEYRSDATA